ncbi:MAG: methyltransferase family protein [Promethearchaeota archaeon]
MLNPIILRIFLIISFFFFGYNLTYIILFKKRHKNNNLKQDNDINLKNTRIFSRIGIHIINIFIFLCCLNIFIYNYWKLVFPSITLFFLDSIIQVIGFSLVIGGNISLLLAYRKLGINWAYPIDGMKKKRKLVKTGIYSKVRHPIYLSFNILCIGFNMILLDWFLLILYVIGAVGLYLQAIDEEKILIDVFGDDYKEYIERTGRFFVKLKKN